MPATQAITNWRTEVQKYIKIPDTQLTKLDDAVRDTVRDFCRNTAIWRYDLDRISTVALTREYPITTLPAEGGANEFVSIVSAKYKEDGMDDDQFFTLDMRQGDRQEKLTRDAAYTFETAPNPDTILVDDYDENFLLYPIPENASTDGLLVRITVMPTVDGADVPLFIYNKYKKEIAWGAAAHLYNQPNQPWSNKKMWNQHWLQYTSERDEAAYQVWAGRTNRTLQVRPRFWGDSRSQDWIF